MHKWPCGPKEKGVLFVNKAVHDRIAPSIYGVYGGAVGISRTFEAEGQRDDAAIAAVVEALKFQGGIGRAVIEQASRALWPPHLMTSLQQADGVKLWTDPAPDRSAAIVIFKPGASRSPAARRRAREEREYRRDGARGERSESWTSRRRRTSTTRWKTWIASSA